MHTVIVSPYLDGEYFALSPGRRGGIRISEAKYLELSAAADSPAWFPEAASSVWGDIDLEPFTDKVLVRQPSSYGYVRATYELNLGCNYDCEHCYLGLKKFEGLEWPDREKMIRDLQALGVLWFQLTGGEPTIDKLFRETYMLSFELGMMISILSNGSKLHDARILEMLTEHRPHDITISVYGATEASYDSLTRRPGSYRKFIKGVRAGHEAGLPLKFSLIVTKHNADEQARMEGMAEELGIPYSTFVNMSPTIYGGAETLPSQSLEHLRKRKTFTGCNAGHTFFHVDPHGMASICKIGREPNIDLVAEGPEGMYRLGEIADSLLLRQGGCTGCTLQGSCGTCMPLVQLYRKANSPLANYCQHGHPKEVNAT
ncbi:radical SAM protein [Nonomuraea gerenzanensis]|uniref:Radical SAM domain heme biosynthesis protein n=1 Tax=Nonomuraea gerenzanensis TaxID=93944 RepID=A0A1M4DVK8_9ACTN|nr:radical SAM protein [Nonomuraea gerenzanensis]UBU12938.1 radical SAM protein [Nonomuraea gerenzanensis]SBO90580.1 Radical SAM domain heme biosynthesis protein [Nonomuraea gerenzanensis]